MARTLIAAALFLAFAVAVTLAARDSDAASDIQGDVNCDGTVTTADATVSIRDAAGVTSAPCAQNGDVNCDGHRDAADSIRIVAHLAGISLSHTDGCSLILAARGSPKPTKRPRFNPTPSPTPTNTTLLTATPTFTATPTGTPTPTPPTPTPPTPTPTPTPSITNTPNPGQTPRFSGEPNCQVFPANNWWNTDISNFPLHANSDNFVNFIGRTDHAHPDFGTVWAGAPIRIPYAIVGGNQPKVPITYYYGDSDPGPYPIPPNVPVEGQPVGQPNTANFGGDRHVIVIDETNCKLYETFDSHPVNNGQSWDTGSAAIFNLNSNALRPDTWTSADAAGLPIFAGLVRYSEVVELGVIDHALRFTVHDTQHAFIHPATHEASETTNPNAPPMGLRFRMKASFSCTAYSAEVQVICTALKKYGMFVADNGSDWYISGAPDSRWSDDNLGDLKTITGNAFEVVDTGEPLIIPDD